MGQTLATHKRSLKMAKAIAFYRRNPQSTLAEVAAACDCGPRLVWQARQQMVIEGVCIPNKRKGKSLAAPAPVEVPIPPSVGDPPPNVLLDGEQLARLAAGDTTPVDQTDHETRTKMLDALRAIAFNPLTYVDTRVTAMKAWFALKDVASAKDLGPGNPMTFEAAVERLSDIMLACGSPIAIEAMERAFIRKESSDEKAEADQTPAPRGPEETTLTPGHPGEASPADSLRPEHLDGRDQQLDHLGSNHGRDDLPRPEAGRPSSPSDPRTPPRLDGGTLPPA